MNDIAKMYQGYWKTKSGIEDFENYERNNVLKQLFSSGEKVLDLASGEGAVAEFIKDLGCQVIALDISKEALKKAAQRGLKTVNADVEEPLPFKDSEFDAVFWGDNVEHLFLPEKTLKEINRVLKGKGKLIISCPNMGYWRYRIYYLTYGMIPQTEWYGQHPWQWEHIRFFNKETMRKFLNEGGFKLRNFHGVSRRSIDKILLNISPSFFGMIMVVEASKERSR